LSRETRIVLGVALLVGLGGLLLGLAWLRAGHPHEDAFILFEYAGHVAAGHGIVFREGGPHAEGATDFLWMLLLAAAVRAGLDVAVAACAWNAVGTAIASAVLVVLARRAGLRGGGLLALAVATGAVLGTGASCAGWVGFGAPLFCGVALLLAHCALGGPRGLRWAPILALLLALLRPEGLALALAFGGLAAWNARRAGAWPAFRNVAALALASATAYYVWRCAYFGAALPLPLYVKRAGLPPPTLENLLARPRATLPGLAMHARWLGSGFGPLPHLAAIGLLAPLAWRGRRDELLRAAALLAAAVVLLALLAPVRQTQNAAYRFQAPAGLLVAAAAWGLGCAVAADARRAKVLRVGAVVLVLAAWLPGVVRASVELGRIPRGNYMDVLPAELDAILGTRTRVVTTEAGRLPFWTRARAYDAVGLNEPRTARTPLTQAYLREIDPDVVMFHVAGALAFPTAKAAVAPLAREAIAGHVAPGARELWGHELERVPVGTTPETLAALALARFLFEADDHDLRLVRYQGAYSHVWAVRREFPRVAEVWAALERAQDPARWRPYATLRAGGSPRG
jgi:hypothetical protein